MSGKTRREAAKNRVGRNDRLGSDLGETKNQKKGGGQKQGRERRWPKTEWAGMTD